VREPNNMPHINLSREADAIVIAPCSADFIARLVQGRSDELLSLMCLARPMDRVPLLLAPAMNREMWAHPAPAQSGPGAADGARCWAWAWATRPAARPATAACWSRGNHGRAGGPSCPKSCGPASADHGRPDLRGHRSGARHHQPLERQDGLCDCRCRAAAGPRSRWWPARCTCPRRAA
jgi:hypothetical protein